MHRGQGMRVAIHLLEVWFRGPAERPITARPDVRPTACLLVCLFVGRCWQNNMNGENGCGNGTPPKHPADVLEALIAAVFLDSSCCMR